MNPFHLPLALLRSFEAAARHQNFTRAARALHLTESAISHHMRRLEHSLGFADFERDGRSV